MPAGRRPGPQRTRAAIVRAARDEFATAGYADTTIRSVARGAEVDPALVYHYFGDKPRLFAATLDIPFDPRSVGESAMPGDAPFNGTRLVEEFIARWEQGSGDGFRAVAQAASGSPVAAREIREFLAARIRIVVSPDGAWGQRHAMIASALVGVAWTRWVLGIEPVAAAPPATVAGWVGPTLDRYATDPAFSPEPPLGGPGVQRARQAAAARGGQGDD